MRKLGSNDKSTADISTTVICKDTQIEATKLISKASVLISGEFTGDIEVSASLTVGDTGKVKGIIQADNVLVSGEVIGNIHAIKQLQITHTGKVLGDVIVGTIVMDEGAQLEGTCRMRRQSSQEAILSKSIEI
ncbi:MAG: cell shape determination protein CcmA [Firmicutes bacterium HGW-Firmicutes-1]|jgi:cytoskeletal protein CcmA (bactofilin family)|nr:MAG: cell shape determination protein CcmA [Firmicutes bacterium HGW-Firmicutes-1]